MKMMGKKWYQDWRSWLAIVLIMFIPTFLLGIIFMWCCAPWSKKAKWWVTGIGLGIPLFGILLSLLLVFILPKKPLSQAADYKRRAGVQEIVSSAHRFCLEKQRCPSGLLELKQAGYLGEIPLDPDTEEEYSYQLLGEDKDCTIKAVLSTGETFSRNCIPSAEVTTTSPSPEEEFPTCNQGCIEKGYAQGSCVPWSTSKSAEVCCSERNSTFISGRYSDCYEQLMEVTSGEPVGGGGIICCCK